jgi:hypothetical protein
MDMVEATKLIQEQATANGRPFAEELIYISETLQASSDIYDAFIVYHSTINRYFSYSARKAQIEQFARDFKYLSQDFKDQMYNDTFVNAKTY